MLVKSSDFLIPLQKDWLVVIYGESPDKLAKVNSAFRALDLGQARISHFFYEHRHQLNEIFDKNLNTDRHPWDHAPDCWTDSFKSFLSSGSLDPGSNNKQMGSILEEKELAQC